MAATLGPTFYPSDRHLLESVIGPICTGVNSFF